MDGEEQDRPWWKGRGRGPSARAVTLLVGVLTVVGTVVGAVIAGGGSGATVESKGDGDANVIGDGNSIVVNNYGPGAAAPSPSPTSADASLCGDSDSGVFGGWGPERPLFTRAHPSDYTTVNSVRDNPDVGDERGFVRVRDSTTNGSFEHEATLVPGHRYEFMVYVHVSPSPGAGSPHGADPVISVNLPVCSGNRIAVSGFVTSDDVFPRQVYDGATLVADRTFNLAYVAGTARVVNSARAEGQLVRDPDRTLFTATGIGFGPDSYDPGDGGSAYVLFSVDPQFAAG